jgi:hypothetical protein
MAKLTTSDLTSLTNETSAVNTINNNNALIETALENTLSRDGTTPNTMSADLDMNGNDLLNINNLTTVGGVSLSAQIGYAEEWAIKAEDSLVSTAAGGDGSTEYSALHWAAKAAADKVLTAANVVSTGNDVTTTNADVLLTAANVVSTNADVVSTNADVVSTNADVVSTAAIANSYGVSFTFSTTTAMADPGSGIIRFNNATPASVTAIAVNDLDADGTDQSSFIITWDDSTNTNKGTLTIRQSTVSAIYTITGLTDNAGWSELAVTYVSGSGTFSDATLLFAGFSRTGDKGADGAGAGDVSGPASATDNAFALFDGTGGKTIKNSSLTSASFVAKTSGTGSAGIPVGTTAERDGSPATGYFRYNSTEAQFEGYDGSAWGQIGGGAGYFKGDNGTVGSSAGDIFRINEAELNANVTIDAAENASATGPLGVASGVTLTVSGTLVII